MSTALLVISFFVTFFSDLRGSSILDTWEGNKLKFYRILCGAFLGLNVRAVKQFWLYSGFLLGCLRRASWPCTAVPKADPDRACSVQPQAYTSFLGAILLRQGLALSYSWADAELVAKSILQGCLKVFGLFVSLRMWQLSHTHATFPLDSTGGSRGRVLRLQLLTCCRRCLRNRGVKAAEIAVCSCRVP